MGTGRTGSGRTCLEIKAAFAPNRAAHAAIAMTDTLGASIAFTVLIAKTM